MSACTTSNHADEQPEEHLPLRMVFPFRIKPQSTSWLPVLEKHDIPIVVGVGVSLAFIFITMAFYSLVQKNEPAPIGRAGKRPWSHQLCPLSCTPSSVSSSMGALLFDGSVYIHSHMFDECLFPLISVLWVCVFPFTAHRNLGLPHRRTGRPETRTYENRLLYYY